MSYLAKNEKEVMKVQENDFFLLLMILTHFDGQLDIWEKWRFPAVKF